MTIFTLRPEFSPKSFSSKHAGYLKLLRERLERLILHPGPDEIHYLRIAIRRYRIVSEMLPKSLRKGEEVMKYISACRELLRATSRVRDMDIINECLAGYADSDALTELRRIATGWRSAGMPRVRECALALLHTDCPRISSRQINRKELNRRIGKVLERTASACDDGLRTVARDAGNTEALHSLRKNLRRVRYVLELFPGKRRLKETLKKLTEWHRVLGSIRDVDITLDYLEKEKAAQSQNIIRGKTLKDRRLKHAAFLKLMREDNVIDDVLSGLIASQREVR